MFLPPWAYTVMYFALVEVKRWAILTILSMMRMTAVPAIDDTPYKKIGLLGELISKTVRFFYLSITEWLSQRLPRKRSENITERTSQSPK